MHTLIIPKNVYREITRIVRAIPVGLETGVTLFGVVLAESSDPGERAETHSQFVVLAVAGPGPHAVHQPAHYAVDHEHASAVYAALGCVMPNTQWLGELHLHPPGMKWLSGGDHRTIRSILKGAEGEASPREMIAGVMQRNPHTIELYPFHFSRELPKGTAMATCLVDPASPLVEEARQKADDLKTKPDLMIAGTDSFECESLVNDFALRNGVPAVYCGCWGAGAVGEILYVVPGKTPCYECYAGFRRNTVEVPEIVPDERKYTDPNFDFTRLSGQPGLFANILAIAGVAFQIVLGLLDEESDRRRLIDHERTLLLFNLGKYDGPLQLLAGTFGKIEKGCAICDPQKLAELGQTFDGRGAMEGFTAFPADEDVVGDGSQT